MSENKEQQNNIWPPPPNPSALHPLEQESEEGHQEPLLTKFAWLDALVGLMLGPVVLFVLFLTVMGIVMYFVPPPRSAACGYTACAIAAGLSAFLLWMLGRRFSLVAMTAALGASILLLFLLFAVWFGSGMMTDNLEG